MPLKPFLNLRFLLLVLIASAAIGGFLYYSKYPAFNSGDNIAALDCINSRPIPPNAYRILFIGDSLTMHAARPNLWDHFGGMAASDSKHDFVHLVTAHVQALTPRPVEIFYDNGGNGKLDGMLDYLKHISDLDPDLVVLQGGENDRFDDQFRSTYETLLRSFPKSTAMIVVGDWWTTRTSDYEQRTVSNAGRPFVKSVAIFSDASTSGYAGPFHIKGVALHPNDKGMRQLAEAISLQLDQHFPMSPSKP